jgi:hypothetical protein
MELAMKVEQKEMMDAEINEWEMNCRAMLGALRGVAGPWRTEGLASTRVRPRAIGGRWLHAREARVWAAGKQARQGRAGMGTEGAEVWV